MIYAKEVETENPRFFGKSIQLCSGRKDGLHLTKISIPDNEVLCNGCNGNLYPGKGYLVYLGKRELKADTPYDLYCGVCLERYFLKAEIVK